MLKTKKKLSNKQIEKNEKETISKIVSYRKAMRDYEKKIASESMETKEVEETKNLISKLRTAVSNLENETFRNIDRGMYLGLGVNLLDAADNEIKPSYLAWDKITNHVGILGASGVGKTVTMLSNIKDTINKGWSAIVVDPKGGNGQEIVNATFSFAKEKGILHNTYYLSPASPQNSFLMNPLFGMSNVEIATSIRDMMMGERTEQFYGDIAYKTVLAILTAFEFLEKSEDFDGEIARKEIDEENDRHQKAMKLNSFANSFDENNNMTEDGTIKNISNAEDIFLQPNNEIRSKRTLVNYKDIAKNVSHQDLTDLRDIIENTMLDKDDPHYNTLLKYQDEALFVLNDTLKQEKDFFGKVSTSLSTVLTKLSAGSVGDIFCTIRTNPMVALLAKKDTQIVLVIQPFSIMFGDIANTVVKIILKQLGALFGNVGSTEREINRVVLFIDEGGSVLYNGVEDLFNKIRSLYGTIMIYTQSYQDYFNALGDVKGKIVLDNINTSVRMRMNNIESGEMVVKELSETSTFQSTTVASTGTNDSRVIIQKKEEKILNPTDVTLLPTGRGIVKHNDYIRLVDFAHYGKIHSDIKFNTNKYFREIDRQHKTGSIR